MLNNEHFPVLLDKIIYYFNSFLEDAIRLVINQRKSLHALTYMILIIMAYYGPNAELMGNIKLAIWHLQKPILDINGYIFNVFLLFAFDLLGLTINGIILWRYCKINILKVIAKLQKEYWVIFASGEGGLLIEVCVQIILNLLMHKQK